MRLSAAVLLALALMLGSCNKEPPNATPDGAVRELVEHLRRLDGDPKEAKAAFLLLSKRAQDNLALRAERYSQASGKRIEPELMIAPASFIERYAAHSYATEIQGARARVTIRGVLESERAEIACVYEDGGWRVDVELPPPPPVIVRSREEQPQLTPKRR